MALAETIRADVLAVDLEGNPLLLVEIKARERGIAGARHQVEAYLRRIPVPFVMLVDKSVIQLFAWDGEALQGPLAELSTPDVLSAYDKDFTNREIYYYHLESLVAGWLDDLLYGWKFENPPGKASLAQTGLLVHLQKPGTAMMTEVTLSQGLTVQRN